MSTRTTRKVLRKVYHNPQDHRNQRIAVLDFSELDAAAGAQSRCRELQTLGIDPQAFSGPHPTGDVYAALVADAPRSTVLRFK